MSAIAVDGLTPDEERSEQAHRHAKQYVEHAYPHSDSREDREAQEIQWEEAGALAGWRSWPKPPASPYDTETTAHGIWMSSALNAFEWRQVHHEEGWHCVGVDNCTCAGCAIGGAA